MKQKTDTHTKYFIYSFAVNRRFWNNFITEPCFMEPLYFLCMHPILNGIFYGCYEAIREMNKIMWDIQKCQSRNII